MYLMIENMEHQRNTEITCKNRPKMTKYWHDILRHKNGCLPLVKPSDIFNTMYKYFFTSCVSVQVFDVFFFSDSNLREIC